MSCLCLISFFFFFNDTATTEIYTLSLHDALPIFLLDISDLLVLLSEAFAPRFLAVWIFFLFGIFLFRRVFRLHSVRRRCRCRAFRLGYRGGRSGCVLYGRVLWLRRAHILVGIEPSYQKQTLRTPP